MTEWINVRCFFYNFGRIDERPPHWTVHLSVPCNHCRKNVWWSQDIYSCGNPVCWFLISTETFVESSLTWERLSMSRFLANRLPLVCCYSDFQEVFTEPLPSKSSYSSQYYVSGDYSSSCFSSKTPLYLYLKIRLLETGFCLRL
jgi:hypothetical protein